MNGSRSPRLFRLLAMGFGLALAIVALAIAELGLHLFAPQHMRGIFVAGESPGMEDARVGHVNRPGARAIAKGPEFTFESAISREGFRDLEDHTARRDPSRPRVLLLGDSFTFGSGSAYADTWGVLFEEDLRARGLPVEVVKAGVPGYDTLREVRYLEMLFPRYHPDFVVIGFVHHDLASAAPLDTRSLDERMVDGGGAHGVKGRLESLDTVIGVKRLLMGSDAFFIRWFGRGAWGRMLLAPSDTVNAQRIAVTRELLEHAREYCAARESRLVVLSIPQELEVLVLERGYARGRLDATSIDRAFEPFAAANGITWIPALPALLRERESREEALYFRMDGHLNRAGNRVVGKLMADAFERLLQPVARTAERSPAEPVGR